MNTVVNFLKRPFKWFLKTRRRNKGIVIILIIVLSFAIMSQIQRVNAKPQYILKKVERGNITELVSETGNVANTSITNIYSPSTGIIEEIYAANNDRVISGQNLFKVKSTATEQEKSEALASYLSAKNAVDTATSNLYSLQSTMFSKWNTFKNLAESNTYQNSDQSPKYNQRSAAEFHIAEDDWLSSESNYKKQQAVISQAQAALTSANLTYQSTQDTIVKATTEGTVANMLLSVGNSVSAKSATTTIPPALIIVSNNSGTSVVVSLNEVDIPKVLAGQKVTVTLDAFPGKIFEGRVKNIDTVGTNSMGVVTYNVLTTIDDPDPEIRPGMTANVDIKVAYAENVLAVQNAAVKPFQGKKAVQVIDPKTKKPKFLPVVVGIKGPEKTEIKSGISEGTEVITGTKNGQVVSVPTGQPGQ